MALLEREAELKSDAAAAKIQAELEAEERLRSNLTDRRVIAQMKAAQTGDFSDLDLLADEQNEQSPPLPDQQPSLSGRQKHEDRAAKLSDRGAPKHLGISSDYTAERIGNLVKKRIGDLTNNDLKEIRTYMIERHGGNQNFLSPIPGFFSTEGTDPLGLHFAKLLINATDTNRLKELLVAELARQKRENVEAAFMQRRFTGGL